MEFFEIFKFLFEKLWNTLEKIIKRRDQMWVLILSLIVEVILMVIWGVHPPIDKDFTERAIGIIGIVLATNFGYLALDRRKSVQDAKKKRETLCQNIQKKFSKMDLALGEDAERVDLEKYFVEPHLKQVVLGSQNEQGISKSFDIRQIMKRASVKDQDGVVIIGKGGAGKTVLLKQLIRQISYPRLPELWQFLSRKVKKKELQFEEENWFTAIIRFIYWLLVRLELIFDYYETFPYPIFVSLNGTTIPSDNGKKLIEDLLRNAISNDMEFEEFRHNLDITSENVRSFEDCLREGLILPIFDGLEMVHLDGQRRFVASLKKFMEVYPACGPFIVSIREINLVVEQYGNLAVSFWEIQPFEQNQIINYLEQIFNKDKEKALKLWEVIKKMAERDARLWTMIANPLLLGLLVKNCAIEQPAGQIVTWDRIDLYEKYFSELWRRKSIEEPIANMPKEALSNLAYQSLKEGTTSFPINVINSPEKIRLNNLILGKGENEKYFFLHSSFHAYFAAEFIYNHVKDSGIKATTYLEDLINRALGKNLELVREMDPALNWVQWQDVLSFLAEKLKKHRKVNASFNNIHTFAYDMFRTLYSSQMPFSKILLLRLLGIWDTTDNLDFVNNIQLSHLDHEKWAEQNIVWLREFIGSAKLNQANIFIALADVGYGLSESTWKKLRKNLSLGGDKLERERLLNMIACFHHPQAASIMVDVAYEGKDLPEFALNQLRRMGLLLVSPLQTAYEKARKEQSDVIHNGQKKLVYLMGFCSPNQELHKVLSETIMKRRENEELAMEAFQALVKWGNIGSELLMYFFKKLDEFSQKFHSIIVTSLCEAHLSEKHQIYLRHLLAFWDKEENKGRVFLRDMAIEITKYKLDPANASDDALEFQDLINEYPPFKAFAARPDAMGRRFIGFLWEFFWMPRRLPRLYNRIRDRYALKKEFLISLLDICAGLDSAQGKMWLILILQDRGLECQNKAICIFCKKSIRLGNKFEWLEQMNDKTVFPKDLMAKIKRKINSDCEDCK